MNQEEQNRNTEVRNTEVMSVGQWVITYLIMMIPCVGIIMTFVWAFSSGGNENRKNYCRAFLIIIGVMIALYLLFWLVFGAAIALMFTDMMTMF